MIDWEIFPVINITEEGDDVCFIPFLSECVRVVGSRIAAVR